MRIDFPDWLLKFEESIVREQTWSGSQEAVHLTLNVLKETIRQKSGGPFAASIWELNGKCVALGVNLVLPSGFSLAHAEMMAISRAQEVLGLVDLSQYPKPLILVSSCEPCAMCYGGTLWSGVSELYYSATKEDAESIGFHEGRKPSDWVEACQEQGVLVHPPIQREQGVELLREYAHQGGVIYNSEASQ